MTEIWFYHLERQPVEAVLPRILAGLAARGDRVSFHAGDKKLLEDVSKRLWSIDDTSFVVHGFSGDARAAMMPILLCTDETPENKAPYLFFASGVAPKNIDTAIRVSIFFDGNNEEAVGTAREQWKSFRDEGCAIKYWKQSDTGRWEDQAMKKAA